MSEQVENLDKNTDDKQESIYEVYLLLYALEIGNIGFRCFLKEALKWSNQVLNTKKQKETTLEEK